MQVVCEATQCNSVPVSRVVGRKWGVGGWEGVEVVMKRRGGLLGSGSVNCNVMSSVAMATV